MKREIPASEFKTKCLQLLDEVLQTRQESVITKRGRPVARLAPMEEMPEIFGRMKGTVRIVGDIIAPIDEKWDADE